MKPWLVGHELHGYYWNKHHGCLNCKIKGPKYFCKEIDLLTLKHHNDGRDVIEKKFFGEIDNKGAEVRNILLENHPKFLNEEERCNFARLLQSLEMRRPKIVGQLRKEGPQCIANSIDSGPQILESEGISRAPSEYYEKHVGSLTDRAVINIQHLVDNPKIGGKLINFNWSIVRLRSGDGSFVLSDRPLVRIHGDNHPEEAWFLPLNPKVAFCAINKTKTLCGTPQRIAKELNKTSVVQAEKFVFCSDTIHKKLIGRYLRRSSNA